MIFENTGVVKEKFLIFPAYVESKDRSCWATIWLEKVRQCYLENGLLEYTTIDGRKWIKHDQD